MPHSTLYNPPEIHRSECPFPFKGFHGNNLWFRYICPERSAAKWFVVEALNYICCSSWCSFPLIFGMFVYIQLRVNSTFFRVAIAKLENRQRFSSGPSFLRSRQQWENRKPEQIIMDDNGIININKNPNKKMNVWRSVIFLERTP